jgi:branched-chain amino acid transport system substrate-binding protein
LLTAGGGPGEAWAVDPRRQRKEKRWAVALGLGLAALLAAGCDGGGGAAGKAGADRAKAGSSPGATTLTFAYLGAMTGELADVGQGGRDAAQLAVDEAGDLPVRLKIEVFDTQLEPAQAARLTADIVSDPKIVGVIGPLSSGETKAAAPTLDAAGVPFVTVASNPDLARQGWKVFHRLIANDDVQSHELGGYIAGVLKARSVVVMHDNSEYGQGLATRTDAALKAHGVSTAVDVIDPRALDYSAAVNAAKARRPDAVFYAGYYPEAGRLVKQLRDAGVTATFVTGDAGKDPAIADGAGRAADGIVASCACADPAHLPDPAAQAFARTYERRFGRPPRLYAAEVYDGTNVLIDAIRRGAHNRDAVLKHLSDARVHGVTKTFAFGPDGEVGRGPIYVYELRGRTFKSLGTTADLAAGR